MSIIAKVLIALIALEHLYFLVLEMFLWTTPRTRAAFGMTAEQAEHTKVLAGNQGLYNGFLAAGLIWALIAPAAYATQLALFFLGCVAGRRPLWRGDGEQAHLGACRRCRPRSRSRRVALSRDAGVAVSASGAGRAPSRRAFLRTPCIATVQVCRRLRRLCGSMLTMRVAPPHSAHGGPASIFER